MRDWDQTSAADQQKFADYLSPQHRGLLLDRLARAAARYQAAGETGLAAKAVRMADFIRDRFQQQLDALKGDTAAAAQLKAVYEYLLTSDAVRQGIPEQYRDALNQLPPALRRSATVSGFEAFRKWRAENPVVVQYEPWTGYMFLDRLLLNLADFVAPIYRTWLRSNVLYAKALNIELTDYTADIDAIRAVMDGNFNVQLGARPVSFEPVSVISDAAITVLTLVPFGQSAGVALNGTRLALPFGLAITRGQAINLLRYGTTVGTPMVLGALAMTAVEVAPIDPQWKGPLRLLAGLTAAVASGAAVYGAWQRAGNFGLVKTTSALSRTNQALGALEKRIDAARRAGRSLENLLAQKQLLLEDSKKLTEHLSRLRDLGGDPLRAVEQRHADALKGVQEQDALANAEGLSPSARAALKNSNPARAARDELRQAENALQQQFANVDRLAQQSGISLAASAPKRPVSPKTGAPIPDTVASPVPSKVLADAKTAVNNINNGTKPAGWKGKWGSPHKNLETNLPTVDTAGNPVTYKEYYLPKDAGDPTKWGANRLVVGSDGNV